MVMETHLRQEKTTMINVEREAAIIRGVDGISPIAQVVQESDGAKITIIDVNGTTTAEVKNGKPGARGEKGEKGDPGEPGASVTIVQTTGEATDAVMSQKAVTDIVGNVETVLATLNIGSGAQ